MNKFTFVLPDGQLFELKGTADTTREQAERIFNEQLAAGALIGLRRGDTIENVEAKIVDFTLSRLDRGTAGVDDLPLLAINNNGGVDNLPLLAINNNNNGGVDNLPLLAINNNGIISALPIVEAPVQNPINTANFAAQTPVLQGIGPLTAPQVQALKASVAASVNQAADEATQDRGVGKYGFNIPQQIGRAHV